MADASLSDIWDQARAFFRREQALLLPIGFATFGLASLVVAFFMPVHQPGAPPVAGSWMLALIPAVLLASLGNLAITYLALRPSTTVGEALSVAIRRLPRFISITLVILLALMVLSMIVGVISKLLGMVLGLDERALAVLATAMMLPVIILFGIRLFLLWPLMMDQDVAIFEVLKRAVDMSRGRALRIVTVIAANMVVYLIFATIVELAGGAVLLLLTRLIGMPELGDTAVAILSAAFNAVYLTLWVVFVARFYANAR